MNQEEDDIFIEDPNDPLLNPSLLSLILDEAHKKIVREDDTIIALVIINSIRFVKNAQPTSGNIILNANSRAGKDYVAKNMYKLIMNTGFIHRSKISPTTFNYWYQEIDNWNWNGKQLLLEDIESDLINSPVFKTMSSGSNSATITISNVAVDLEVRGKPNITCTGFDIDLQQETLGRYAVIHIDESKEQTRAIKKFISQKAKGCISVKFNKKITQSLARLSNVDVVIPFVDKLIDLTPNSMLMRDIYGRCIDYIKASAALHQRQREKDNDGRTIAVYDDYIFGRITLMKTYSNVQMISTTMKDEKVLDFIKKHQPVSANQIANGSGVGNYYCYDGGGLNNLERNGMIYSEVMPSEKANRNVLKYFIMEETGKVNLPLFPIGVPIDNDIKNNMKEMIKAGCNLKTEIPNLNTSTTYNSNGILVLRYLIKKSREYYKEDGFDSHSLRPENQKDLPYIRYFGFSEEELTDELFRELEPK